jgi:hypothetical protein
MQFVLTGFKQDLGFRVFAFSRVEADRTRTEYTVRADLTLSRKYLIPMQELPLLCRNRLARSLDLDQSSSVTFSEEDMRLYASDCAAARQAARGKKRPSQRMVSGNLSAAWRGHTQPGSAHPSTGQSDSPGEHASLTTPGAAAYDPISKD